MCSFHDANIRITSLISGILFKLAVQVDFSQRYGQQAFIWVEQISVRHGLNTVGPIIRFGICLYLLSMSCHDFHGSFPFSEGLSSVCSSNASSIRLSW